MVTGTVSRRQLLAGVAGGIGMGPIQRNRQKLPNVLVIFGGSPGNVIEYEFSVTGRVRKTRENGGAPIDTRFLTVDKEDNVGNGNVTGAIAGGGDAYRYSGVITYFKVKGKANVYLNGNKRTPKELTAPTGSVKFDGCQRVRVKGPFQIVAINTAWFDQVGFATSYFQFGPIRRRRVLPPRALADEGISGFVVTSVTAYKRYPDGPQIDVTNPSIKRCIRRIRPPRVEPYFVDCRPNGDGTIRVLFGYNNPTTTTLRLTSSFEGTVEGRAPRRFRPNRHAFAVDWKPTGDDDRLVWRLNLESFGYARDGIAVTPLAADCAETTTTTTTTTTTQNEGTPTEGTPTEQPPTEQPPTEQPRTERGGTTTSSS
ncbi:MULTISPECIES: hypothetical protein [unclassified Haladaptatus]|uniref:hypothetical protein n=1 Tax=unclassified Haladaptatus TaxID=2622732 RepID=UPI00209C35A4|nr:MULTISPECIES: hypothetical protein [unclassified Haladaptatus]MCO8245085.1 hypothetical protein [Haladaptatus sp. AB643]MCO8253227.1 hypothetical protein [Haladaptatus sp. AB618]